MFCSLQGGRSALHVAAEKGHTNVVDILVKHGADVDTKTEFVIDTCAYILVFQFVFIINSNLMPLHCM